MNERAGLFGVEVAEDGFVFSLEPDCALPMPAEYLTRPRMAEPLRTAAES
jgi:hypothetical protein